MSKKRILVTSALPYANGPLHIGHIAGAYLPADIYTRYKRLKGDYVIHICGTDEHGVAITIRADKEGKTPREIVDYYHQNIKESFEGLGIDFDNFSRTSLPIHHKNSQEFFLRLYEKGLIYKKDIEQYYCENCKRFLPDRYVEGTCPHCGYEKARGDQCEKCGRWLEPKDLLNPRCAICGSTPVLKKSFHYYFKLKSFEKPLLDWLLSKEDWKENVKNTAISWVREGLEDRAITRDLEWGVPVPLEEAKGKVLYVWFDAPIGYISSTMEWANKIGKPEEWKEFWMNPRTELIHFIGKDNIIFHAIVWPAMLMGHGDFILPTNIPANEFLNLMGAKLSTSRGWAIWIPDLLKSFPPDYIRFGLASVMPETKDSDFTFEDFKTKVNAELVNNLGNFVNRTLSFIKKYMGGRIEKDIGGFKDEDLKFIKELEEAPTRIGAYLEKFEFKKALKEILALSARGNQYFDYKEPWATRKKDMEETKRTLYLCASLIRSLSTLIEPYLPFSAKEIRKMLNLENALSWDEAANWRWDRDIEPREVKILYKKIEEESIEIEKEIKGVKKMETISFEEFQKCVIKIGKILEASEIEGASKLLKLTVDIGDKKVTLVAGIKEVYKPEDIVGKEVPVLVNLEPKKIKGILSEGMILAADLDGRPVLLHPDREVPPGSIVR